MNTAAQTLPACRLVYLPCYLSFGKFCRARNMLKDPKRQFCSLAGRIIASVTGIQAFQGMVTESIRNVVRNRRVDATTKLLDRVSEPMGGQVRVISLDHL